MRCFFTGKTLSCLATTGTIGVVTTLPKIQIVLLSPSEKETIALSSSSNEEQRLEFVNAIDSVESKDLKEKILGIDSVISRITDWLNQHGGCRVELAINASTKQYFKVHGGAKELGYEHPIFSKTSKASLNGKSKIRKFAEDLESRNDDKRYVEYRKGFIERCRQRVNIRLQWRDLISKSQAEDSKMESKGLEGLRDLWVDEK